MRDRGLIDESSADPSRFWCPYTALEEYHAGMWKTVQSETKQNELMAHAVSILRNETKFQVAINRVLKEWPTSCSAEFTSPGNHLAWLGQAACCIEAGVPESLTRRAWWKLTIEEQNAANRIAYSSIKKYDGENRKMKRSVQFTLFNDLDAIKSKRYWCSYEDLEEYKAGMWKKISNEIERDEWTTKAVAFLTNSELFVKQMKRVLVEWPISCKYNFSNPALNKPVWLAHAGACLYCGIPEEFMRLGYWKLTQEERDRADKDAVMTYSEYDKNA